MFGYVECVNKILKRQTQLNVIDALSGTTANVQEASKNEILVKDWFLSCKHISKNTRNAVHEIQ